MPLSVVSTLILAKPSAKSNVAVATGVPSELTSSADSRSVPAGTASVVVVWSPA
jgi:hypothetical protein